jgi:heme/copper-type cytochrome/quinol oxidase subunit 1
MQYGGGLAALPIGIALTVALLRGAAHRSEQTDGARNALLFSLVLFAAGGVIGFLITGANVTVPAHYHGSIVAVTLAYMGTTYHLLPRLGFRQPRGRMVRLQPVIYGSGQLLHVLGLAWSGGYGVQRKTAGAAQGLDRLPEIAGMGLMGLGGLIAIVGGLLFLVICFKAIWPTGSAEK